jgi:hypothetical protein
MMSNMKIQPLFYTYSSRTLPLRIGMKSLHQSYYLREIKTIRSSQGATRNLRQITYRHLILGKVRFQPKARD